MSYHILFSDSASSSIKQLDNEIARRVLSRIKWFTENYEYTVPLALKEKFTGLYKFRIGNYRLIYSVNHQEKVLNVLYFAHRKDAYRKH